MTAPRTRALLQAARRDGPDAAARDAMWDAVTARLAGAPAPHDAPVARPAPTTTPPATPTLPLPPPAAAAVWRAGIVGGIVGGALAAIVGIALPRAPSEPARAVPAGVRVTPAPRASVRADGPEAFAEPHAGAIRRSAGDAPQPLGAAGEVSFDASGAPFAGGPRVDGRAPEARPRQPRESPGAPAAGKGSAGDDLAREAALLAAARSALRRGAPADALAHVAAARALPTRQMEPEARALERRARAALDAR